LTKTNDVPESLRGTPEQNARVTDMRKTALALTIMICAGLPASVQADPYRWCADYSGGFGGGGTNCGFVTLEQCRATVSGIGGFCRPNPFYDGRPVVVPEDAHARSERRSRFRY
jgi:hypothetical protein